MGTVGEIEYLADLGDAAMKSGFASIAVWVCLLLVSSAGADPSTAWTAVYDSPYSRIDYASAMTIDDANNVYVTGSSQTDTWDFNITTVAYDAVGSEQWVARHVESGVSSDLAAGIAVDSRGYVNVVGTMYFDPGTVDIVALQYDTGGTEVWLTSFDGPDLNSDYGRAIVVDTSDHVYVAGDLHYDGSLDYFVAELESDGTLIGSEGYNLATGTHDHLFDVFVDGAGNVYLTGYMTGASSDLDYVTVKYTGALVPDWHAVYDGPVNGEDIPREMVVDGSGNVYVTGSSEGILSTDYLTVKYDDEGVQQWVSRYEGPGTGEDVAYGIVLTTDGHPVVTGKAFVGGTDDYDYATIKYDAVTGSELWVVRHDGTGDTDAVPDVAFDLVAGDAGSVYIAGNSSEPGPETNCTTIKYDVDGDPDWIATQPLCDGERDVMVMIDIGASSRVCVVSGTFEGDYLTTCYDSCDCEIGGTCYADGQANPTYPCEICDVATSMTDWTMIDGCASSDTCVPNGEINPDNLCMICTSNTWFDREGASCDDGFFCNGIDTCSTYICEHAGFPCPQDWYCNEDSNACEITTGEWPFVLDTTAIWQDSGMSYDPMDGGLVILATGETDLGYGQKAGPDGIGNDCPDCVEPNFPFGALLGRIISQTADSEVFLVGSNYYGTPGEAGEVYLMINDKVDEYYDNGGVISVLLDTQDEQTGIELVSFEAEADEFEILLTWETASETENAGFHLWRSRMEADGYARVTISLIPAEGDAFTGSSYEWMDGSLSEGTYYYKLEDVDVFGNSTFHGPVNATVEDEPMFGCGS